MLVFSNSRNQSTVNLQLLSWHPWHNDGPLCCCLWKCVLFSYCSTLLLAPQCFSLLCACYVLWGLLCAIAATHATLVSLETEWKWNLLFGSFCLSFFVIACFFCLILFSSWVGIYIHSSDWPQTHDPLAFASWGRVCPSREAKSEIFLHGEW